MRILGSVVLLLATALPLSAQAGGVLVRIPADGAAARCINPQTDKVWITLRRLIVNKNAAGWFTTQSSVAVLIKASVAAPGEQVEFPLMSETTFGAAPNGQVSIPVEYNVISGLRLNLSNEETVGGIRLDLTLLNAKKRNRWGSALATLAEITKGLPIPATPFAQASTYLLGFANGAVEKDLASQASDDKVKSATLALNFASAGKCTGDFESTGTIAVLQSEGVPGANLVPVDRTGDYCWAAVLQPTFTVKAAKRQAGIPCGDARYGDSLQPVSNNYVGFFINAVAVTGTAGPKSAAVLRDEAQSIARCRANGIAKAKCI